MSKPLIAALQAAVGVKADGVYGPVTHTAVMKALGKSNPVAPVPASKPLDARSEERLKGVDPRLANVVRLASTLSPVPFMVIEGLRTKERQAELYAQGRTKPGPKVTWTMASKHIEGKAVDLAPVVDGKIDWNDLTKFDAMARAMRQAAAQLGVVIRHGADWDGDGKPREKGESDNPHFEIG